MTCKHLGGFVTTCNDCLVSLSADRAALRSERDALLLQIETLKKERDHVIEQRKNLKASVDHYATLAKETYEDKEVLIAQRDNAFAGCDALKEELIESNRLNGELRVALRKACSEWRRWVEDELSGTDGFEKAMDGIRAVEAVAFADKRFRPWTPMCGDCGSMKITTLEESAGEKRNDVPVMQCSCVNYGSGLVSKGVNCKVH